MRTTITIDDDVLTVAKAISHNSDLPLGRVISDLAKKALQARPPTKMKNGFPVFKVDGMAKPITLDDVKKSEDEP